MMVPFPNKMGRSQCGLPGPLNPPPSLLPCPPSYEEGGEKGLGL